MRAEKHLPDWLTLDSQGLYCVPGDFYIDPMGGVDRAVVTHGHADHARPNNTDVICTPETAGIMGHRYGDRAGKFQELGYHKPIQINEVALRFVPAGHILGSAQAVMEYQGERVVVSGDYKRRADPTCAPFEPVPCDLFVTEATFGLPVFTHPPDEEEIAKLLRSLQFHPDRAHLIGVYALGKCQRLMKLIRQAGYHEPIYLHGAMIGLTELYESYGQDLGEWQPVAETPKETMAGKIVLCPPSAVGDRWSRRFGDPVTGVASGWMRVRQRAKQKGVELPLVISDHADWNELLQTLKEVNPGLLLVTHGQEDALVYEARRLGYAADALHIEGLGEESDEG